MPLIKSQLVRLIASDTGLSQKKSSKMLNLLLGALTDSLAKDNNIKIAGFGKFYSSAIKNNYIYLLSSFIPFKQSILICHIR